MVPAQDVSDDEILLGAIAGNAESLDIVVRRVWPKLYRLAFVILRRRDAAEDAAQDAALQITRHIRDLKSSGSFAAWYSQIAVRSALRLARRERNASNQYELTATAAFEGATAERLDTLRALMSLPEKLRVPIALHYYADLKTADIAGILDVPAGTVRFRLSVARQQLADILRPPFSENAEAS